MVRRVCVRGRGFHCVRQEDVSLWLGVNARVIVWDRSRIAESFRMKASRRICFFSYLFFICFSEGRLEGRGETERERERQREDTACMFACVRTCECVTCVKERE